MEVFLMTKPVLAVDFDDVVAGFNQAFVQYHNHYYGTNVQYEGISSYDMTRTYGTDNETIEARVVDFYNNHHDMLEPLKDAIEHLKILRSKFRLEVVTNRCESVAPVTMGWKMRHVPRLFSGAHYANGFGSKFPERKRRN
jgi:5'(3')-deoxyribonucleotidase